MSILIKGMEMPKNEELIIICSDGTVEMTNNDGSWVCKQKAIEIPPHGRLIDADALKGKDFRYEIHGTQTARVVFARAIELAPTIIESEGE